MKILIAGADGYIGWALTCYLRSKGHEVFTVDNFSRRDFVHDAGSESLFPLDDPEKRLIHYFDLAESPASTEGMLTDLGPEAVVHLAEQPSAPWSMKTAWTCRETQRNNILGTLNLLWALRSVCPHAHLVKLGTMGEYSDWIYGDTEIPESSRVEVEYKGQELSIPTPRWAGSFYHWSKVYDSFNIEFATKLWGLRATDINQGIVYGTRWPGAEGERTRFDYDSYFGTVVNRFVAQAVAGVSLSVYGKGGQTRGFIHLQDSIRAIELILENPPEQGEFRVINQLTEVRSVVEVAKMVTQTDLSVLGFDEDFCLRRSEDRIDNPRVELETHDYSPRFEKLREFGLTDPKLMEAAIPEMVEDVAAFKDQIITGVFSPTTKWR